MELLPDETTGTNRYRLAARCRIAVHDGIYISYLWFVYKTKYLLFPYCFAASLSALSAMYTQAKAETIKEKYQENGKGRIRVQDKNRLS